MKTLKTILKQFDDSIYHVETIDGNMCEALANNEDGMCNCEMKDIEMFLVQSIKDALEACRVEKKNCKADNMGCFTKEGYYCDKHDYFNQATTQYDENVKLFMGDEEI